MTNEVRIGVAGAGVFGGYHAAKYAALPEASLVGVYDPAAEKAAALAARHGVAAFSDFTALIAEVDALVIASPATAHFDQARLALGAGRHVFVEKPMALHLSDAETLCALARAQGAVLQIGHQERFALAAAGLFDKLPRIRKIRCVRAAPRSGRCEDVSVVFDLMIHDLDLARRLIEADAVSFEASGGANEVEAAIRLEDGAELSFYASRLAANLSRLLTVECDGGVIEIDFVARSIRNSTAAPLDAEALKPAADGRSFDALAFGAQRFVRSILEGEAPIVCGDEGAAAVAWAEKIEAVRSMTAPPAKVESVCV